MAKGLSLCLVVLLALASSSVALKCYFCLDCENESAISGDCPEGHDSCAKTFHEGKVAKSCVPTSTCEAANLGKDTLNSMQNLLGGIGGADMPALEMPEMPELHCCTSNYCNAASIKMMNPALLLLLPLALYFLRC